MSEQNSAAIHVPTTRQRRRILLTLVGAGLILLVGANVHLVYVAMTSQPDCVAHQKNVGAKGVYRAARSSC